MCRGAIRHFKLNTLVSGKLWSDCVLFQEGGIRIWSVFSIFIVKFLSPAVLRLLYVFFFPDPTVTTTHLYQIFHIMVFVLVHSMCLFLVKRQLHKMMLRTMRRLGGIIFSYSSQQWCSFLTVRNYSVFIVHLKVNCDICSNFPSLKEKLQVCAQYCLLGTRPGLICYSAHWKTISGKKGDILYLKMYIKWCQRHPGGQRRLPMEAESGFCAQRLDTPLSGGSVMALSFSRHVPGSFDTGNMHAGWQCPGRAAQTMMYISFSSLTDWRL